MFTLKANPFQMKSFQNGKSCMRQMPLNSLLVRCLTDKRSIVTVNSVFKRTVTSIFRWRYWVVSENIIFKEGLSFLRNTSDALMQHARFDDTMTNTIMFRDGLVVDKKKTQIKEVWKVNLKQLRNSQETFYLRNCTGERSVK